MTSDINQLLLLLENHFYYLMDELCFILQGQMCGFFDTSIKFLESNRNM